MNSGQEIWQTAPKWANWLAQDSDGEWFWHERKPSIVLALGVGQPSFWTAHQGEYLWAKKTSVKKPWDQTLEKRP